MSRIGKKPVEIPQGVEVKIDGQTVSAKGPLGTEVVEVRPEIAVKIEDNHVVLSKVGTSRETDALYGLSRTLVANAIQGVKEGFVKKHPVISCTIGTLVTGIVVTPLVIFRNKIIKGINSIFGKKQIKKPTAKKIKTTN